MSYTEIYSFNKEGSASLAAEIRNAWRGGMAIWGILEERHLPPYIPNYVKGCNWFREGMTAETVAEIMGYTPTRCAPSIFSNGENPTREIWNLADDRSIPEHERIVLFTTFDKALIKKEDIPAVIEAFKKFGGETSLPEQAEQLEKLAQDENCIAIGWNQTSVNSDTWSTIGGYDEENDEPIPYNCLKQSDHYWIFEAIQEGGLDDE